jgi:hypothetical protein
MMVAGKSKAGWSLLCCLDRAAAQGCRLGFRRLRHASETANTPRTLRELYAGDGSTRHETSTPCRAVAGSSPTATAASKLAEPGPCHFLVPSVPTFAMLSLTSTREFRVQNCAWMVLTPDGHCSHVRQTPDAALRLLSLDGGERRGMVQLLLLRHLPGNLEPDADDIDALQPCAYFDITANVECRRAASTP